LMESWGVREGFVTTWEALEQVLWQDEYMDPSGNKYPVRMTVQDAMGHRTSEVYTFCLVYRGKIFPSFGRDKMAQAFTWTNLQYFPGKKKPIPGGLKGINVNTKFYKDSLSTLLEISPADPGAWHENAEFAEAWAYHMTSEYINEKGAWDCRPGAPNHLWDCAVLCLVAHDILGVKFWPEISGGGQTPKTGRRVRNKGVG
jgi:phage terminase large subunit GpA